MAHQYPALPPFGNGYPPVPYYSPYAPNNAQPGPNAAPAYQHPNTLPSNPQTPTPQPTNMRYEANAHIQQHTAPFSFPPPFNPDLLKHLPPPPPPLASFNPASVTPASFAQYSQDVIDTSHAYPQLNFSAVSQANSAPVAINTPAAYRVAQSLPSPSVLASSFTQDIGPTFGEQNIPQGAQVDGRVVPVAGEERQDRSTANLDGHPTPTVQTIRDAKGVDSRPLPVHSSPVNGSFRVHNLHSAPAVDQQQASQAKTFFDLRERAKAAILSLTPHKITYRALVAEGINATILKQFYSELGLDLQSTVESSQQQECIVPGPVQDQGSSTPEPSRAVPASASSTGVKTTSSALARASSAKNSAMERKDRIAQLLAAKAGKNGPAAASPSSASPASATEAPVTRKNLQEPLSDAPDSSMARASQHASSDKNAIQPETITQRPGHLKQGSGEIAQGYNIQGTYDVSNIKSLVPQMQPVRDNVPSAERRTFMQAGFSSMIPGLFMAVDEETSGGDFPDSDQLPPTEVEISTARQPFLVNTPSNALSNHKRPIASVPTDGPDDRVAKRRAFSCEGSVDVAMEIDGSESGEASEGEIVEDDSAIGRKIVQQVVSGSTRSAQAPPAGTRSAGINHRSNTAMTLPPNNAPPHISKQPAGLNTSVIRSRMTENELRKSFNNTQGLVSSPLSSGATTPATSQQTQTPFGPLVAKSQDPDSGSKDVVPSPRPLSKLTPAQLAERAAQLKADLIRQKAMRQKQLIEGIPALDDEVVKTTRRMHQSKTKLAEIRTLLARYEADVARAREDERQVLEEIDRLEKLLSDGVSGQKQFSDELRELQKPRGVDPTVLSEQKYTTGLPQTVNAEDVELSAHRPDNSTSGVQSILDISEESATTQALKEDLQQVTLKSPIPADIANANSVTVEPENSRPTTEVQVVPTTTSWTDSRISLGQEPAIDELDVASKSSSDENQEDELDEESMDQPDSASEDSRMSIDDDAEEENIEYEVDSDGSASMSDSGSEDYEPAEPSLLEASQSAREESDEYDPEAVVNGESSRSDSANDYEPSESVGPVVGQSGSPSAQNSHPPSPTEATSEPSQNSPAGQEHGSRALGDSRPVGNDTTDDTEIALELTEANTLIKLPEPHNAQEFMVDVPLGSEQAPAAHFIPYQSPLSAFKSFRFHPSFNDQVKSGYRSLTYSNKIDPRLPLCPTELAGEVCADQNCQEQHFESMALTDDKILVQMSSANDIKDKAQRDQYLLGLKQVIASLRQGGVKEFSQVADALSKYRRDWSAPQQVI